MAAGLVTLGNDDIDAELRGPARLRGTADGQHRDGAGRTRLGEIGRGQADGLGIDVVQHGAVDTDGRVGAGIIYIAGIDQIRQPPPVPDRVAGIAAFAHIGERALSDPISLVLPLFHRPPPKMVGYALATLALHM